MKNINFYRVCYDDLSPRQQENFNFQKVSALLADYGFMTLRLSSDWESADFIAQHIDGVKFLKVQLKGRFGIDKKYMGKELHICFPDQGHWYLCPHDMLVCQALKSTKIGKTDAWSKPKGNYHSKKAPKAMLPFLANFMLE